MLHRALLAAAALVFAVAAYAQTATTIETVGDDGWTLLATWSDGEIFMQPAAPANTVWVRIQAAATADPTTATGGLVLGKGGVASMTISDLVTGDEVFGRSLSGSADVYVAVADAP